MSTVRRLLPILVFATIACVATSAHATERSDHVTIAWGDSVDIPIDFSRGASMSVEYSVEVVQGPNVWVYFVNQGGYSDYNDPREASFAYYESWSDLSTSSAQEEFTLEEYNTYYLIIENSDESRQSTNVKYSVTYGADESTRLMGWAILGAVLISLPLLLFGFLIYRKTRARLPPPTPYDPSRPPGDYLPVPPQDDEYRRGDTWYEERRDEHFDHVSDRWERDRSRGSGSSSHFERHGSPRSASGRSNASPVARMRKRL